jgi:hypothetical protein
MNKERMTNSTCVDKLFATFAASDEWKMPKWPITDVHAEHRQFLQGFAPTLLFEMKQLLSERLTHNPDFVFRDNEGNFILQTNKDGTGFGDGFLSRVMAQNDTFDIDKIYLLVAECLLATAVQCYCFPESSVLEELTDTWQHLWNSKQRSDDIVIFGALVLQQFFARCN